jgi:predicted RNA-binding protein with TRAM domain
MNPQPLTVMVEATPAAAASAAAEGQEMVLPLPSTPPSSSSSSASSSSSSSSASEAINDGTKPHKKGSPFPKKGQRLEMLCESLAFKGKGVCKTVETGFVVLCDRALPGERLIALITKKKGSFA